MASPYTLESFVKSSPIYQKRYDPKTKKAYVSNTQTGKEISFDAGQGQLYGLGALDKSGSHIIDDPGKLISSLSAPVQPSTPIQSSAPTQPAYTSPFSDKIGSALAAITNRPSFSYDSSKDVGLQSAQTNAMDAVSRSAARRNMLYSDSNKAQMGQSALALVPQFEQVAYGRYADEGNNLYNQLNALSGLENTAYGQYRDTVGDTRYADETGYNRGQDTVNRQERATSALGYMNPYSGNIITPEIQAQIAPYSGDYQAFINANPNSPLIPYVKNAQFQKMLGNASQFSSQLQPFQTAEARTADRNYDRGILESDRNYNRGILESDRSYGLDKQRVAKSGSGSSGYTTNQQIDNELAILKATGKVPPGGLLEKMYGVQGEGGFEAERKGIISAIRGDNPDVGQLTPEQAYTQIEQDQQLGLYTPQEAAQLKSDLYTLTGYPKKKEPFALNELKTPNAPPLPTVSQTVFSPNPNSSFNIPFPLFK